MNTPTALNTKQPANTRRTILLCLAVIALNMTKAAAETRTTEFVGKAYDVETSELLYTEEHRLEQEDGVPRQETVRYVTPNGDQLAQKDMTYWRPERPAYQLTVTDPARTEIVKPDNDGVSIESVEAGTLEWSEDAASVIDGGFHYFIVDHFDTLLAGDTVDFQFLAPARVRWLALRVSAVDQTDGQLMLELNVQNRVLSWVISDIELTYDIDTQRLLSYRGLTNLPKPGGGNYTANIAYQYPEGN